jgi:hypothetical protein
MGQNTISMWEIYACSERRVADTSPFEALRLWVGALTEKQRKRVLKTRMRSVVWLVSLPPRSREIYEPQTRAEG